MQGQELDFVHIFLSTGIVVKVVMGSLIAGSITSWAVVLNKKKQLSNFRDHDQKFLDLFRSAESFDDVRNRSEVLPAGPLKNLFREGDAEFQKIKGNSNVSEMRDLFKTIGPDNLARSMGKAKEQAGIEMETGLTTLASIGSVAPFVGLLGTVWGIMDSFLGLASGGGTLDAVAPGIAEALIATAVGLFAAIPAVWFFNHFNNQIQTQIQEMDSFEKIFSTQSKDKFLRGIDGSWNQPW